MTKMNPVDAFFIGLLVGTMHEPILKWGKNVREQVKEYEVSEWNGWTRIERTERARKEEWIESDTAVKIEEKR